MKVTYLKKKCHQNTKPREWFVVVCKCELYVAHRIKV